MEKMIPLILAFFVLVHHYYTHRKLLEWSGLDSHEVLAVFLLGIWIGLMIS